MHFARFSSHSNLPSDIELMYSSETLAAPQHTISLFVPPRDDNNKCTSTAKRSAAARSKHASSRHIYVEPTDDDVLRGRGGGVNSNSGKRRLFEFIRPLGEVYVSLKRGEKAKLSQQVVDKVHGWGGRFLEMEKDHLGNKHYYEMNPVAAVKLVEQKFRDDPTKKKTMSQRKSKKSDRGQKSKNGDDESTDDTELTQNSASSSLPGRTVASDETGPLTNLEPTTIEDLDASLANDESIQHNHTLPAVSFDELEFEQGSIDEPYRSVHEPSRKEGDHDDASLYSFRWEAILEDLPPSNVTLEEEEIAELYHAEVMDFEC